MSEMSVEQLEGVLENEHPYRHPELHEQYPERLLANISEWEESRNKLTNLPVEELEEAHQEFRKIESEHLQPHKVTVDTLHALKAELISVLADARVQPSISEQLETKFQNLLNLIEDRITDYGVSVRQHVTAGRIRVIRPEQGDKLMEEAYRGRGEKHEQLIDALRTLNTFCAKEIPDQLTKASFHGADWKKNVLQKTFKVTDLSNRGPKREYIGVWALDMDIVQKARRVESVIQTTIVKKRAEVA